MSIATQRVTAEPDSESSLDADTVAVLSIVAHDAAVVGDEICTDLLAPDANVPNSHVSFPAAITHSPAPVPPSTDHDRPDCAGNESSTVTPTAEPGPAFDAVIVNPIVSPNPYVAASGALETAISGHCTATDAESESDPSYDVATVPVLSIVPQLAAVVELVTCTDLLAPAANVPNSHVSSPAAIEHPESELCSSIDHTRPAASGNASVTVTSRASPSPTFATVSVNPISSPAFTDPASATFSSSTSPHSTSTDAESVSDPSLLVLTEPVLSMSPQLAAVVGDVMWTDLLPPPAIVPKSQVSFPSAMEQPESEFCASIDQTRPSALGSVSVTVTSRASPSQMFSTVSVKPISSPALTESASAVLVRSTLPQRISTEAESVSDPSFVVVTVAVLSTVPQSSLSVAAITWTVLTSPASSVSSA